MSSMRKNRMQRDRRAARQPACSRPMWWPWNPFIHDELLHARCASRSVQHLVVPGPSPTWLFESGLPFLPFSRTRGNLEAVVGINRVRDLR